MSPEAQDTQKPETLTLTIRLHDPKEKLDPAKSTAWTIAEVPREDLALSPEEFSTKYCVPAAAQILATLAPKQ